MKFFAIDQETDWFFHLKSRIHYLNRNSHSGAWLQNLSDVLGKNPLNSKIR